jgi:hypothetical protein
MADCPAEGEWFGVYFKLGTFMPLMRSGALRDRNDVTLPKHDEPIIPAKWFSLGVPEFREHGEVVDRLVRRGLIVFDRTIEGVLCGQAQSFTARTEQRRVLQVTGLDTRHDSSD